MDMDELTLDFILELEKEQAPPPKFSRKYLSPCIPAFSPTSQYIKLDLDGFGYPCTFPYCNIKQTHFTVDNIPYCSGHLFYPLLFLVKRLEGELRRLRDSSSN